VPSFPSPSILSARLELREFSLADADLVREVAANAEQEALPPGASRPQPPNFGFLAPSGMFIHAA